MLHTLLGEAAFRAGLDRYFARHDGGAATIEDLLAAMSEVSDRDLAQFARWYDQAGTPELHIRQQFDPARREYVLEIEQHAPGAASQPLHIPLAFALYAADGSPIDALPQGDAVVRPGLIELTQSRHVLRVEGLARAPLPAFLQGLSAPVRLQVDYSNVDLARLIALEPDPLTRWEATQRLATQAILAPGAAAEGAAIALVDALGGLLDEFDLDPGFIAECHQLPDLWTLADQCAQIDLDAIVRQREDLLDRLAETHAERYERRYRIAASRGEGGFDAATIAQRRLRNLCLARLTRLDPTAALAASQYAHAVNLTDRLAALTALLHHDAPDARAALAAFRARHADNPLVTDKWLALVATRPQPDTVEQIAGLLREPLWLPRNPNRVRALLGSFARGNAVAFHRRDGAGYDLFFAQIAPLDAINPQVAARQLPAIENWRRLDPLRRELIERQLRALGALDLSRDCRDVVARLLA
jgi:aminopeptidase N